MIEFTPKFFIPSLLLKYLPKTNVEDSENVDEKAFRNITGQNYTCEISWKNVNPEPVVICDDNSMALLIGCPILEDKIDKESAINKLFENGDPKKDFLEQLNGEFLFIHFNVQNDKLTIVNDRFTSIPLYYYRDRGSNAFYATPYFSDLRSCLKKQGKVKLNESALFEFIWLQRILGTKTYIEDAFFLPDASILTYEADEPSINRYWQRDYTKSTLSIKDHARQLADLTRQSIRRKTSDGKRYGHFLSGGMDSRSVLAAFQENFPVCFTVAISENRELRTARNIAHTKGAEHVFLKLGAEHYSHIYEPATRLIGGMYNFDHAIFLGYHDIVTDKADVCFHGHGYDYMFQGMYIPSKRAKFLGRNLHWRTIREIPEDLLSFYIDNVSYRIKGADIPSIILKERWNDIHEQQRASVGEIVTAAKNICELPNDQWEYLTFHHLSRHYSFPNHASISTYLEQRVISFDIDIFNLYLSLPVEHRFDGLIEKQCLKILDPELANIWSANTNLPVTATSAEQTFYQITGAIKRKLFLQQDSDEWKERTWLLRDDVLREQSILRERIAELCNSDTFEQLQFLNLDKIRTDIPRWLRGENVPGYSGDLVNTLLTLGTFLQQS